MHSPLVLRTGPDDVGRRLDRVLRRLFPGLGLSALHAALRRGGLRVNGQRAQPGERLATGDRIEVDEALESSLMLDGKAPESVLSAPSPGSPATLDGLILLATPGLLFLTKPRGLESHGRAGLDLLVSAWLGERRRLSLSFHPGPLHRLDRNTSGLIVFPASAAGARQFTGALREGRIGKRYIALLSERLSGKEAWEDVLIRDGRRHVTRRAEPGVPGARSARATATLLLAGELDGKPVSLALVELETGFTHQIRAQAALRGMPLVGDAKYGGPPVRQELCPIWYSAPGAPSGGGYFLHAWVLRFEPPLPGFPAEIRAPLPDDARLLLEAVFGRGCLSEVLAGMLAF